MEKTSKIELKHLFEKSAFRWFTLLNSFLSSALNGGEWSTPLPAALPPGKTWYPLYRRLDGPHGRSGRVRKIEPPQGFDSQTIQSVVIRYPGPRET